VIVGYSDRARPLTPRMRDVLAAGARGLTVTQTAAELTLAESTVWNVRAAAVARLAVPNFTAAVAAFVRGEVSQ
jgi:two-component system, NarL family, response regulator DesR